MSTKLDRAKPLIFSDLDRSSRVFSVRDLQKWIGLSRLRWDLASHTTTSDVVTLLKEEGKLRELSLRSRHYPPLNRLVWGEVSPYRLAASLWTGAYLTHGSAVFLHGLTDEIPKIIYVNKEQREKTQVAGQLTQERIDIAFSRPQRVSSYTLAFQDFRIVVLSGKNTKRLEVGGLPDPFDGDVLHVTKLERTIIDIVVRPSYAGGIVHVLDAYRGARERISIHVVIATLRRLGHVYPYHQAIGFLLDRIGVEKNTLEPLRGMGLEFDFYLVHGMKDRDYDPKWRLFFPKGL